MRYVGLLLFVAFVGLLVRFAVWICLALMIIGLHIMVLKLVNGRAAAREAIAARADEENKLFLAGDPRGLYGKYHPEIYPNG